MLNITVQPNVLPVPSLPTIGISTKPFDIARKTLTKVSDKVINNKYIQAFTVVLTAPVE